MPKYRITEIEVYEVEADSRDAALIAYLAGEATPVEDDEAAGTDVQPVDNE